MTTLTTESIESTQTRQAPKTAKNKLRKAGITPGVPSLKGAGIGLIVLGVLLVGVAPAVLSTFALSQLGKFICYAIVAVGIGLAWGRGGMLTLGQGAFFGAGAYFMAMNMKLSDAALQGNTVPDFMALNGTTELPGFWAPFASPAFTIAAIVLVPALVAGALGFSIFKRRVKDSYFAILNQALVAAVVVLLVGQQDTLGGSNGLNGFQSFFGLSIHDPVNKMTLYMTAAATLLVMIAISYYLMRSRFGELLVATRDAEERVRFLGYDPAVIKTVAYVIAAIMASIAGALFVPIVGIISPTEIGVMPSIAFVIGVAVGGRASLFGPALGALAVAWAESYLAQSFPSQWSYFQGFLLITVILLLPGGLASGAKLLRWKNRKKNKATATEHDGTGMAPQDRQEAAR